MLQFTTSGGPKVNNSSLGKNKTQPSAAMTINFDIDLQPNQNFGDFVQLSVGGVAQSTGITHKGSSLTLRPTSPMQRCSKIQIQIKPGLVNIYGIGNGPGWQTKSRVICQEVFSIGRSVEGRDITAYKFGRGASAVLFASDMHGNEKSSVATLVDWINHLEENSHNLPAHRSVIVIPNHNPDGYRKSSRTNASGVDLNRNFPNPDWVSLVYMPGNTVLPNGGGPSPLDQPESAALANHVQQLRHSLVLTYHAVAGIVISNDAGNSIDLARRYANDSKLRMSTSADSNDTFAYTHTGEFEDWLGNILITPALLIELKTMSKSEINTHRSAMWNIIQ